MLHILLLALLAPAPDEQAELDALEAELREAERKKVERDRESALREAEREAEFEALVASVAPPSRFDPSRHKRMVVAGATLTALSPLALGFGFALIAAGTGEVSSGPNCSIGKPCGDTCVAASYNCTLPPPPPPKPDNYKLIAPGAVLLGVGVASLSIGVAFLIRAGHYKRLHLTSSGFAVSF